ncbi:hypothetical protein [Pseudomonas amygdali]|uniref:Uncharacterized protein n=1 Tax=Pseudomonas amygdali pv. lachrymans str. M301315 TaxID=629260 RepID=A0AAD0PWZ5_PSEAV|nr:hypothetical protein [Pseudomonas amygdali]AXH60273.1 hypothetical protein PLA107_034375 [Pseudomonas amygdali pv. lachrymans str. M301315]
MSVRIYAAYRMRSMSMNRLQAWCDALSIEAAALAKRGYADYLATQMCQKLDNHTLGFEPLADTDPWRLKADLIDQALSDRCCNDENWELSLRILADSKYLYILSDYRGSRYKALLDDRDGLEPFNYQNSSDTILDGVSPEEWVKRGNTWARLLKRNGIPESGFLTTIVRKHQYCFPSPELVRRALPSLDSRSTVVTTEHQIAMRMDELAPQYPNKPALLYREAKLQILATENEPRLKAEIEANKLRLPDVSALLTEP